MLLVLAANTSFADFPRLSSILARDGFLPRTFQFRGDRLAFNSGIMVLAVVSALLIVAFGGSVTALIPLYTVGVFIAFTLSQAGMVRHWWRLRATERGWRAQGGDQRPGLRSRPASSPSRWQPPSSCSGAWVVLLLIPVLIGVMLFIRRQYRSTAAQLRSSLTSSYPGRAARSASSSLCRASTAPSCRRSTSPARSRPTSARS